MTNWKEAAVWNEAGYYELRTEDTGSVPVRLFLTPGLLMEAEDGLYPQIVNATRFPGVKLVVITPDVHVGYGVPVGCVLVTDGTLCLGPVGYDIGCFPGYTRVRLANGQARTLHQLVEERAVFECIAFDAESHQPVVASATAQLTRTHAELVRVSLADGAIIDCTPDHRFLLANGNYEEARHLTGYDELMGEDPRSAVRVLGVEDHPDRMDVYCLTVPKYHNFLIDDGVFVHNCGMISARSDVDWHEASPEKKLAFNRAAMLRIEMGAGGQSTRLRSLVETDFANLIRGGAEYYCQHYGARVDRSVAERHCLPVDDSWQPPYGGRGRPDRGITQLGSLGSGKVIAA